MIYGCNVCACKLICCIAEENKPLTAEDKNPWRLHWGIKNENLYFVEKIKTLWGRRLIVGE